MKKAIMVILALLCVMTFAAAEENTGEATLTFSSFGGSGAAVSITVEDPEILTYRGEMRYDVPEGEPVPPGAGYTETYFFTGLKAGTTRMTVLSGGELTGREEASYLVTVDEDLKVTLERERRLSYFWFTFGGYMPSVSYEVFPLQDGYYLHTGDGPSFRIDPADVEALCGIIAKYDLVSWDGFSGNDPYALDGEGFSMRVSFTDGTTAEASGENKFPDHYHNASAEITELLDRAAGDRRGDVTGIYRYEDDGFGGDFTITINRDGTYTFYEGPLSSYMGGGTWWMSVSRMYMTEENGLDLYLTMIPTEDALVFVQDEYSDNFPYIHVPDGGRFIRDTSARYGETASLVFDSFDGGGPSYAPEIEDPGILKLSYGDMDYIDENHEEMDGAGYHVVFCFAGLKAGTTKVTVHSTSPLTGDEEYIYTATVDENLNVLLESVPEE